MIFTEEETVTLCHNLLTAHPEGLPEETLLRAVAQLEHMRIQATLVEGALNGQFQMSWSNEDQEILWGLPDAP